jgi:hypothetical protein
MAMSNFNHGMAMTGKNYKRSKRGGAQIPGKSLPTPRKEYFFP